MGSPRLQRTGDVVERVIAEETFLLPVKGDLANRIEMFVLSEVGRFIWGRADGSRDREALVAEVLREFDVDEAQARTDVDEFLDRLLRYGLVTEVEG